MPVLISAFLAGPLFARDLGEVDDATTLQKHPGRGDEPPNKQPRRE